MDILLALLVLAVGFLLTCAWQLMRSRYKTVRLARQTAARGRESSTSRRALQRISAGQLKEVLGRGDDLVLLDLRPAHQNTPLPVQAPHVVRVRTSQLEDVLQHLPENRSAVFYGASDLSLFMITTSLYLRGSAPLYVLSPEFLDKETA